ncbi:MAG TPA: ribosome maturation factor RimM [bacterium]|jgi:16S rRNA processing protein RimM
MKIGLISGAFGIKGEIKIYSLLDEPGRFSEFDKLVIETDEDETEEHPVSGVKIHKGFAMVKLEGFDDRNKAEEYKDCYVLLGDNELTPAEIEQKMRERLIGLRVTTSGGEFLGVIEEVIRTGANDVYEVVDGDREALLPAIDDVIKKIDLENGTVTVDLLPGLLE